MNTIEIESEFSDLINPNIHQCIAYLTTITRVHCDILNSLFKSKESIKEREVYIETLILKIIFSSQTATQIASSTSLITYLDNIKIDIIDLPSLKIITRSIIESFLTLEYLFFNKNDEEINEFRYKLWKVSGLISRQKFDVNENEKFKEKKQNEAIKIDELLTELKKSAQYKKLDNLKKNKLDKYGLPRHKSWSELINGSSIKPNLLKNLYSLYSNYAHSEYISAIQINESCFNRNDKFTQEMTTLNLNIIIFINSVVIKLFVERFKCGKKLFDQLPVDIQFLINLWNNCALKK